MMELPRYHKSQDGTPIWCNQCDHPVQNSRCQCGGLVIPLRMEGHEGRSPHPIDAVDIMTADLMLKIVDNWTAGRVFIEETLTDLEAEMKGKREKQSDTKFMEGALCILAILSSRLGYPDLHTRTQSLLYQLRPP